MGLTRGAQLPFGPVRDVSNRNRKYTNSVGVFHSFKVKGRVAYESGVERRFATAAELCPSVSEYYFQPLHIPVNLANGDGWAYTPDVLLCMGRNYVCELKHDEATRLKVLHGPRAAAARRWAELGGKTFVVCAPPAGWDRLEKNLQILMLFREVRVTPALVAAQELLQSSSPWLVSHLVGRIDPEGSGQGLAAIKHLIARGVATVDLNVADLRMDGLLRVPTYITLQRGDQIAEYLRSWWEV